MLKELFFNNNLQKDICFLLMAKFTFALTLYLILAILLDKNMFLYPDFVKTYSNCSQLYTNIFYTKFFCGISNITNISFSHKSFEIIVLAAMVNSCIAIYYYKYLYAYLTRKGQLILIAFLAFHPYMAVYFFRFYTEIFGSLGILLIFSYAYKQKDINAIFILFGFLLINFRNALIPVFFMYGLYEIVKNIHYKKSAKIYPFLLLGICFVSYLPLIEFSLVFTNLGSVYGNSILDNIVYTLGFRESVSISGGGFGSFLQTGYLGYIQIIISLFLIFIHILGFFGILKFSIKNNISIMICFTYLILPVFSISHMRYLLPLMPILLFGFCYIFFKVEKVIENV